MTNKKDKSGEIKFNNNPFSNEFDFPVSQKNPIIESDQSQKTEKVRAVKEIKEKKIEEIKILPKKQIIKVGFEIPEELDRKIEFIALDRNLKKKDLFVQIIEDWIKNND